MKPFKRVVAIVLMATIVCSLIPFNLITPVARAVGETEVFAGGKGTEDEPYLISTTEHLDNVRNYLSAHFKLINEINFAESEFDENGSFYNNAAEWIPIGSENMPFSGVFDGNGYCIGNLQISGQKNYSALFAANSGTIKNLDVNNALINSKCSYTGGIAGLNKGIIDNCSFSGIISACFSVGGITGANENSVIGCINYGSIVGNDASIGGISGRQSGTTAIISYCENLGSVKSTSTVNHYGYAGGILGSGGGKIERCTSRATVTGDTVGGIAGKTSSGSILYCSNMGAVIGTTTSSSCGGIIGNQSSSSVKYCYNSGAIGLGKERDSGGISGVIITGVKTEILNCYNTGYINGFNAGGILGWNHNYQNNISCCYNVGEIKGSLSGGIAGRYNGGVRKCYYLNNIATGAGYSSQDGYYSCDAFACSEELMKQQSNYTHFDFDTVWELSENVNDGFPYLKEVLATVDMSNVTMSIYSHNRTLTICKNETVEYAIQMKNGDQVIYGSMLNGSFDFLVTSSDSSVFAVSDVYYEKNGVVFFVTGHKEGKGLLIVQETKTQQVMEFEIWVTNGIQAFNAEALPTYYDADNEYNGYINGIYIDSFKTEEQLNNTVVSFDAYNTHCISGVVLVYDKTGKLYGIETIDRFGGGNITGIADWVVTSCSLFMDMATGDLLSYKANHLSKKTSIQIIVPHGGRIEITNNVWYSEICALVNYTDIITESVLLSIDMLTDTEKESFRDTLSNVFLGDYISGKSGDTLKARYCKLATEAQKVLIENATEKTLQFGLMDNLSNFVDNGKELIKQNQIDLEQIFREIIISMGIDIPLSMLTEAMGPFGKVLGGMFKAAKYSNFVNFYLDLKKTPRKQALLIQFIDENGGLTNDGISINSENTEKWANENYVLQTQAINQDMLDDPTYDALRSVATSGKFVIKETELLCNGESVQPEEPILIAVSIPEDYVVEKTKLYKLSEGKAEEIETVYSDGSFRFIANNLDCYAIVQQDALKFSGASLILQNNLSVNFKVDKNLFEKAGYESPCAVFEFNGSKTVVTEYSIDGDRYVFPFRNIAPDQMDDTIYATLYATYDGVQYASQTREYSVAEYCYSMLVEYSDEQHAKLRTLLVDLLHYGSASQAYTGYHAETPVDKALTDTERAWGTNSDPVLTTVLDTAYQTVENPKATWKGAGLNLKDSVSMRFKLTVESTEGLQVKITSGEKTWTVSSFVEEDGVYYVYFRGLNAGQMRQEVYLTVYEGDVPVSNTVCYSIESYAYEKQGSTVDGLADLVKAMMRYGDSAYAYVNGKGV